MAVFTVSTYEPHPEGGPFVATVTDCQEVESEWQGKKSIRLRWVLETNAPNANKETSQISYFTGMNFGRADAQGGMRAHLRVLMDALGILCPDTEDDAASFDVQDVMGASCLIMVVHEEKNGVIRDKIASMRPRKKLTAATASAAVQGAPKPGVATKVRRPAAPAAAMPTGEELEQEDPFTE